MLQSLALKQRHLESTVSTTDVFLFHKCGVDEENKRTNTCNPRLLPKLWRILSQKFLSYSLPWIGMHVVLAFVFKTSSTSVHVLFLCIPYPALVELRLHCRIFSRYVSLSLSCASRFVKHFSTTPLLLPKRKESFPSPLSHLQFWSTIGRHWGVSLGLISIAT